MRRPAQILAVIAIACASVAGLTYILQQHAQRSESYPPFSSFRTLPEGASILYDALLHTPQISAERNILPLGTVQYTTAAILMLGIAPATVAGNGEWFNDIEELAFRGNRVIVGFQPHRTRFIQTRKELLEDALQHWKIHLDFFHPLDVRDDEEAALIPGWPMFFAGSEGWEVTRKESGRAVVVERVLGKGSIVLLANGFLFANAAMVEDRQTTFLANLLGPMHQVVFDETHFGIEESGSIAGLARHYRLQGLVLGLIVTTALFIWRNAAGFPPPPAGERAPASVMGEDSNAAFLNLLRRNLKSEDILSTCVEQWRRMYQRGSTSTSSGAAIASAIDLAERGRKTPAQTYVQIQQVLNSPGRIRPQGAKSNPS